MIPPRNGTLGFRTRVRSGRSGAAGSFPIPDVSEEKRAIGKERCALMCQDTELEAFKREIDMRQFAVSLGYEMDRRESWRGSAVLRSGDDKIVVKRNGNGHYVFFSVRDDSDHGTVIDFLQRRENLSLGAVRQILRPWIGRLAIPQFPKLEPTSPDRMRVESEYRQEPPRSALTGTRKIVDQGVGQIKVSKVGQIKLTNPYHRPLRSPHLRLRPFAVFAHSRLQPFLDQAQDPLVCDSVLDKLEQPFVPHLVEKAPNVRIQNPVHPLPFDAHTQRVQRLMRTASWPKPIAESSKVHLINLDRKSVV